MILRRSKQNEIRKKRGKKKDNEKKEKRIKGKKEKMNNQMNK